jgi:nucleoid-associated protein YgaU
MGCVQQAVLEFDSEVQAPWRPRLVPMPESVEPARVRPMRPHPSRRTRVGVCAPPTSPARPVAPARRPARPEGLPATTAPRPVRRGAGSRPAPSRAHGVRLRLTRRARRLAVVMALAAGVALGSWVGPLLSDGSGDLRLAGGSSVVVQSGDTLWSIATSLEGDGDVRAVVDELQRLNDLDGVELVPGQVLQLP